jgi:hypothetical protein
MLTILAAILGFAGPFIPELIKIFRSKQDNAHELAMMELQAKNAEKAHLYKVEELNLNADINEAQIIRQPQTSFGVQVLDAAKDWPKLIVVPIFYLFALLDFFTGMVRPVITYSVVGFYFFYKWALYELALKGADGVWQVALSTSWGESDWALLLSTVSYWFGSRIVKSQFGGSANTGKPGGG